MATTTDDDAAGLTLARFLADLQFLGPARFVVQGDGAILEAVGAFEDLRFSETPKGALATVSLDDEGFECHIRCERVREAAFVEKESADGTLYIVRLLGDQGESLLSVILNSKSAEEGSTDFWKSLRDRFGANVPLSG